MMQIAATEIRQDWFPFIESHILSSENLLLTDENLKIQ